MYIYIYLYSKREKERERKKSDVEVMCVWVRATSSISYVGEKNERNVPPRDKTHTKKEEIIVSFSRRGDAAI